MTDIFTHFVAFLTGLLIMLQMVCPVTITKPELKREFTSNQYLFEHNISIGTKEFRIWLINNEEVK